MHCHHHSKTFAKYVFTEDIHLKKITYYQKEEPIQAEQVTKKLLIAESCPFLNLTFLPKIKQMQWITDTFMRCSCSHSVYKCPPTWFGEILDFSFGIAKEDVKVLL